MRLHSLGSNYMLATCTKGPLSFPSFHVRSEGVDVTKKKLPGLAMHFLTTRQEV